MASDAEYASLKPPEAAAPGALLLRVAILGICERTGMGIDVSDIELSVICRECGSEVSPYVTECPYCGSRVRKRAPELEHHDDHFEPKPSRKKQFRLPRLGRGRIDAIEVTGFGPAVYVAAGALLLIIGTAAGLSLSGIGAVVGSLEGEWWRLATAPFAYDNVGYLFAVSIAIVVFGVGLERRLGPVATLVFLVLAGVAGTAGGYAVDTALETGVPVIAGANSVALAAVMAWIALWRGESRRGIGSAEPPDWIGVGVVVSALLLLPLLETSADVFAGLAGALFGALAGLLLAALRRS